MTVCVQEAAETPMQLDIAHRQLDIAHARHDVDVTTSPALFRLQVMGNWWTWLRRAPSNSGRMQRSTDDTTDEKFLLLDYEQKQRFEGWAAKLHACSYSDLYCLAIYIV